MKSLALIALVLISNAVRAARISPPDVEDFKKNADLCEHFAGEWDSGLSKKRQAEIERAVVNHCGKAQQQLQRLRKKYKDAPSASADIEAHANSSVVDFKK